MDRGKILCPGEIEELWQVFITLLRAWVIYFRNFAFNFLGLYLIVVH